MLRITAVFFIILLLPLRAESMSRQLKLAVKARNIPKIRNLIEAGVDLDAVDENGKKAIRYALDLGYSEIVRFLIAHGAEYCGFDRGIYHQSIVARNSCYVDCHQIEAAIHLFNMSNSYCEQIRLKYNLEKDQYVETEISEEMWERIRPCLLGRTIPHCREKGVFVLYPRKNYLAPEFYSKTEIGVYCTFHGIPDIGFTRKRQELPRNTDILMKKYPYSFKPRFKPDTRNF